MIRGAIRLVVAAAILGSGAIAHSAELAPKKGAATIANVPGRTLSRFAAPAPPAPSEHRTMGAEAADAATVTRGRDWWPYRSAFPPYNEVGQRRESMGDNEIAVNGVVTIDIDHPDAALQRMPTELVLQAGSQLSRAEGYYLVKIEGFTRTQVEVDALTAAGAVLGEYLNVNTYIAKIPSASVSAVKALPFVDYVGDYQPAFKISPRLGLERIPVDRAYDGVTGKMKPWELDVTLQKGADVQGTVDAIRALGATVAPEDIVTNDAQTVVVAHTAPEAIPSLAGIPGVKFIAEKTYPHLMASSSFPTAIPMLLQNDGVYTTNKLTGWQLWNEGIDGAASGTSQIVTVMDTGLNTEMEHFSQDTATVGTLGASHRKVVAYDNFGGDVCVNAYNVADGGHGTLTSQHAVGSISNMVENQDTTHTPTENYDNGIARAAKVYFQDIGTSGGAVNAPADQGPSLVAAIAHGSFIQNNSWGADVPVYDSRASNLDTALFANPGMVVTVAAGNTGAVGQGTLGTPATSKNCIAVGGADGANPDYLFIDCLWDGSAGCTTSDLGSARGPVGSLGRVKPDILTYMAFSSLVGGEAMAEDRPHAMCQTDSTKTVYWDWTNNSFEGGTSFSAPQVAGLAALVRDYFVSGFYPTGTKTPADTLDPSGSLVKAVILASGEDMQATAYPETSIAISKRYSNDVGYGRANLPSVLHVGSSPPFLWVQNHDTLGDAATKTFYYTINGSSTPLRIMMDYYDAAGDALQKDADLKVTIGGNVYWGNNFSGGWSTSATSTQDHTNNTEGVFLDAAHGLPASGTVQVDVIGYNNPGGMNYSLVVSGDVASQDVTQVSLDKGKYNCSDTIGVTVNDTGATSPVDVTLVSKDGMGTTIDTQIVSCTGSGGVFTGTIQAGSGISIVDGGSLVADYPGATSATANVDCQIALADAGYIIAGGCDNDAAGTDPFDGPLTNGGHNEFYTPYMDGGEYSSYTVGFVNQTGHDLSDVWVNLSFSGAGASKMTVFNNPVHVGAVPADGLAGAVFQVYTDPSVAGLTAVNMDFDLTSPADGYTAPSRLTHVRYLQADDVIVREQHCSTFDTTLSPWYEAVDSSGGGVANPWRWISSGTVGSENRTDTACGSATNAAAMVGNAGTTPAANNFAANAFSFLLVRFQPVLTGNAPNGRPYEYAWKWHSFFHASEALGNQTGAWGAFYSDRWNNATNATAADAEGFPLQVCCYYQTVFDYVGTWNWETANTGTPDDPHLGPSSGGAPNQIIITFPSSASGPATSATWFSYGHLHWDLTGSSINHRDVALDNERLVYDEFYADAQSGASCGAGGQVGQVAFDRYTYGECPASTAVLSVLDPNATGPLQVTVTSPGTGDSEVVTLTGTAPYFSGTLTLATDSGVGADNGVLFVLPSEVISASYTDGSPSGTSTASALIGCTGGDVIYESNAQVSDNGDNDGIADNNETVTMDITIHNGTAADLTNTQVTIIPASSTVDCVPDAQALYGTIAAGASGTNPPSDRFIFHVAPSVACSDWQAPPTAKFIVIITADGFAGSSTLQTFSIDLDLDPSAGGSYTYTQNFDTDPGWLTNATPDDDGNCAPGYSNSFHWCAACGNAGGGYGAWVGDSAFGTSGQNYPDYDSSTLYSPVFTANGNVGLTFSVAYRTETTYDGALVQAKVGGGAWTTVPFTTPAQSATSSTDYCSPLALGATAWNGTTTGTAWTTTNSASVTATGGQAIQFRWRLGSDSVNGGTTYGGYGVDSVSITNLQQTRVCEPTRNTGLATCSGICTVVPDGSSCDDGNPCTSADTCSGGTCTGTGTPPPPEVGNNVALSLSGSDATITWSVAAGSTASDVLRGALSGLPVGPGGGDEVCLADGVAGNSAIDSATPAAGTGYWYLVRGTSVCGNGTYGYEEQGGAPTTERTSTTCP